MIAPKVLTEGDLEQVLRDRGFRPTTFKTATGRYWCDAQGLRHVLVPDSLDGYYPDWMLYELEARVGVIAPSGQSTTLPHFDLHGTPTRH